MDFHKEATNDEGKLNFPKFEQKLCKFCNVFIFTFPHLSRARLKIKIFRLRPTDGGWDKFNVDKYNKTELKQHCSMIFDQIN